MKPPGEITATGRPTLLARFLRGVVMLVLAAAVLGAAVYAYGYLKRTRAEVPRRPAVERVWSVRTLPVVFTDHRPTLITYGTATPSRRVDLRALVSGEVLSVSPDLREGGVVKAGEELLRIDDFDYRGAQVEARANLAEARARLAEIEAKIALETDGLTAARAQLEIARRDLERVEQIVARGAVSEKTVDDRRMVEVQRAEAVTQRENQLAIEHARAEQQRAAIERLEWRVRQSERNVANTVLRAPFDAYVSNVTAQAGRLVGINDAVATLIDARSLDVRFVLTDAEFGRIADDAGSVVGRPVTVTWQVGDTPRSFAATVERVTPQIEAARGGIEVFARIADADMQSSALLPRPGAFVEVAIEDKAYRDTAQVPATALYGTDTLFVVTGDRLAPRRVEIVGRSGSDLLVRGDLKAGERVVVTRITEAGAGVKVRDEAAGDAARAGGGQ